MAPSAGKRDDESEVREELVEIYDRLRDAMICFFQRYGIPDPEGLANDVFLRVLIKTHKGLKIKRSLEQYCWRVARFVRLEQFRRREFMESSEETPAPEKHVLGLQDVESSVLLNECFAILSDPDCEFVRRYLHEEKRMLARELGTNPAAMAIRFYKLKKRLEEWVRGSNPREKRK